METSNTFSVLTEVNMEEPETPPTDLGEIFLSSFRLQHNFIIDQTYPSFFNANSREAKIQVLKDWLEEDIDLGPYRARATSMHVAPHTLCLVLHSAAKAALAAFRAVEYDFVSFYNSERISSGDPDKEDTATQESTPNMIRNESTSHSSQPIRNDDDNVIPMVDQSANTKKPKRKRSQKSKAKSADKSKSADQSTSKKPSSDKQKTQPKSAKKLPDKKEIVRVMTGYTPKDEEKVQVHDIMVYDIPAKWTPEQILNELILWGQVISASFKKQQKYQTVQVKLVMNTFSLAQFDRTNCWTTDLGGLPV